MVAWFIIAIATLAVFAFIAVNGVQTVAATNDGIGRVETARRLDAAANALIARTGAPTASGKSFVLAGQLVNGVYGLPAELGQYATTPFGQRIVYCPFGDGETGTTVQIPAGPNVSYPVETLTANGRTYVVGGRPTLPQVAENPNLLGYLLAPRTKNSPTPTCRSVSYNPTTRKFEAPDALVRPLIRTIGSEEARDSQAREVIFYVSQTGNGRGLTPNDPTNFQTAIEFYRSRQPFSMRIELADGNYILPTNFLNRNAGSFGSKSSRSNLSIINRGTGAFVDQQAFGTIAIPGNLYLSNITFDQDSYFLAEGASIYTIENSAGGSIIAFAGGTVNLINAAAHAAPSYHAVTAFNGGIVNITGTLRVDTGTGNVGISSRNGGQVNANSATINLLSTNGTNGGMAFLVEANSSLSVQDSIVNVAYRPSYFMVQHGQAQILNTNVNLTVPGVYGSIILNRGGRLVMANSILGGGNPATYGLIDDGAAGAAGDGIIRATYCWTQYGNGLFSMSSLGNGASSAVTNDEALPTMSASPTSAEIQAYSAAVSRNQRRSILRPINRSSFTCQS